MRCRLLLLALCASAGLVGCASSASRAEPSGYACMVAVRNAIPADLPDSRKHCLAAGGIAQQCGVIDARVASVGKEVKDLFGAGDASWSDWRADRAGMQCAKSAATGEALAACCTQAGYP
jgi:hypothetical protein